MNCLMIARGSTFSFTINLPEDYDISDAKAVWVTFMQSDKEVFTKTNADLDIDKNHISVALSQEDTLAFHSGHAVMQVRLLLVDDNALVQIPTTKVQIFDILKDGVIG